MNKIFVSRDNIETNSNDVLIKDNVIKFLKSDIYLLEYEDISEINLCVEVSNNLDVTLFESSFLKDIKVNNKYIVDNASLCVNKFYNNDNVLENIDIDLFNEGRIDYKFSNICKNNENYVININHNGVATVSNINNKSIALDGSKLNFVINSIVSREYEKSVLDQNTRIVTLGESDAKLVLICL